MTNEDLEAYLRQLGFTVAQLPGAYGTSYTVIHDYPITTGSLARRTCDVALQHSAAVPYVAPAAIHTRPALVPMDMVGRYRTQQSPLGSEWQYWSRLLRGQPTPQALVAHIATIFSEV